MFGIKENRSESWMEPLSPVTFDFPAKFPALFPKPGYAK
jgi:hypothetical protein